MTQPLGVSGRIAAFFQAAHITPLLALLALLLGVFAVLVTPREEEPQINVTMANVLIPFPGASVRDVEQMVATPAEQVLSQIAGVEHVMSVSRPGLAVITVQFKVGVPRTEALVRLYDTVNSNADWLPRGPGRAGADHQAQGHRRRADRHADAVQPQSRDRRLRPGARRAQRRGRAEARARHARGRHHRRPGPRGARRDRPGAHGRQRRHRGRPARRAAVGQPRPAGGRAAGRQPRRGGRVRPVPERRARRRRAGGRRARRQAGVPAGRGHGARRPAAGRALRLARRGRKAGEKAEPAANSRPSRSA